MNTTYLSRPRLLPSCCNHLCTVRSRHEEPIVKDLGAIDQQNCRVVVAASFEDGRHGCRAALLKANEDEIELDFRKSRPLNDMRANVLDLGLLLFIPDFFTLG